MLACVVMQVQMCRGSIFVVVLHTGHSLLRVWQVCGVLALFDWFHMLCTSTKQLLIGNNTVTAAKKCMEMEQFASSYGINIFWKQNSKCKRIGMHSIL